MMMQAIQGLSPFPASLKATPAAPLQTTPLRRLQEGFEEQVWAAQRGSTPEISWGKEIQSQLVALEKPYKQIERLKGNFSDPTKTLAFVQSLTAANLHMEIASKVMGSVSQAINRLVSMQ